MLLTLMLVGACDEKAANPNKKLKLEAFSEMKTEDYVLDSHDFDEELEHLLLSDRDSLDADLRTRKYYKGGGVPVWVSRYGVTHNADTLLNVLKSTVTDMGFNEKAFFVEQIAQDLKRVRTLSFDETNDIVKVTARLDYLLTKAFLRYSIGQRFGFVEPYKLFNHLVPTATDSLGNPLGFQVLFDVAMQRVKNNYEHSALKKVSNDSLAIYLRDIQPKDSLYDRLKNLLPKTTGSQRMKLLCNMERRRWRVDRRPDAKKSKYVLVNVPAYHLWAVSPDTVVDMRVVCGALKTRTPLLTSQITHMVVNPEWVIPMSIIQNDIAHHAGDPSYFSRRGYYIAERKNNKRLDAQNVTSDQLLSGALKVVQNSGPGNSLGRIMFRFDNKFNVFLHDTSSRGHFMADNRGVSHGCVRLHHPYDLAAFVLDNPDEWLLDKLRISMDMKPLYEKGREYMEREDRPEHPRLVSRLNVPSRVPIFITYYTIYPDPEGQLQYYTDVYGYDAAMGKVLRHYSQ